MFVKKTLAIPLFVMTMLSVIGVTFQLRIIDAFLSPTQNNHWVQSNRSLKDCTDMSYIKIYSSTNNNDEIENILSNDRTKVHVRAERNNRRGFLSIAVVSIAMIQKSSLTAANAAGELPDQFNVDAYLKSGMVLNPMGVSGQAGKSKPVTGILLREGSEVSRDGRTGDVLAEILLQGASANNVPVLASFVAPWPLASGTVFDVECRNPATGDGAFLAVSSPVKSNTIQDISDSFFVDQLIGPKGRFSSYGTPTDVKVRSSTSDGSYRTIDITFSTLSQSTQTELPRRARIVATIPDGTRQAVMLVGSASQSRWNKSSKETVLAVTDSFRAVPAPTSMLRLRAKERRT